MLYVIYYIPYNMTGRGVELKRRSGEISEFEEIGLTELRAFTEEDFKKCNKVFKTLKAHELSIFVSYLYGEANKLDELGLQFERIYRQVFNDTTNYKTEKLAKVTQNLTKHALFLFDQITNKDELKTLFLLVNFGLSLAVNGMTHIIEIIKPELEEVVKGDKHGKST